MLSWFAPICHDLLCSGQCVHTLRCCFGLLSFVFFLFWVVVLGPFCPIWFYLSCPPLFRIVFILLGLFWFALSPFVFAMLLCVVCVCCDVFWFGIVVVICSMWFDLICILFFWLRSDVSSFHLSRSDLVWFVLVWFSLFSIDIFRFVFSCLRFVGICYVWFWCARFSSDFPHLV